MPVSLGGIWTGISVTLGKLSTVKRRKGRDMKPVRLAVMEKVEFPNPYIKAGGGGWGGVAILETLSCFLCVIRVVSLVLSCRWNKVDQ